AGTVLRGPRPRVLDQGPRGSPADPDRRRRDAGDLRMARARPSRLAAGAGTARAPARALAGHGGRGRPLPVRERDRGPRHAPLVSGAARTDVAALARAAQSGLHDPPPVVADASDGRLAGARHTARARSGATARRPLAGPHVCARRDLVAAARPVLFTALPA